MNQAAWEVPGEDFDFSSRSETSGHSISDDSLKSLSLVDSPFEGSSPSSSTSSPRSFIVGTAESLLRRAQASKATGRTTAKVPERSSESSDPNFRTPPLLQPYFASSTALAGSPLQTEPEWLTDHLRDHHKSTPAPDTYHMTPFGRQKISHAAVEPARQVRSMAEWDRITAKNSAVKGVVFMRYYNEDDILRSTPETVVDQEKRKFLWHVIVKVFKRERKALKLITTYDITAWITYCYTHFNQAELEKSDKKLVQFYNAARRQGESAKQLIYRLEKIAMKHNELGKKQISKETLVSKVTKLLKHDPIYTDTFKTMYMLQFTWSKMRKLLITQSDDDAERTASAFAARIFTKTRSTTYASDSDSDSDAVDKTATADPSAADNAADSDDATESSAADDATESSAADNAAESSAADTTNAADDDDAADSDDAANADDASDTNDTADADITDDADEADDADEGDEADEADDADEGDEADEADEPEMAAAACETQFNYDEAVTQYYEMAAAACETQFNYDEAVTQYYEMAAAACETQFNYDEAVTQYYEMAQDSDDSTDYYVAAVAMAEKSKRPQYEHDRYEAYYAKRAYDASEARDTG
jgi:hypothetical protein